MKRPHVRACPTKEVIMVNMLFSLYNFHEEWAKEIVGRYISSNDNVLIIPFSFGCDISNDTDWQYAYNRNYGKYYNSIIIPFLSYGIAEKNINWVNYFSDTKEDALDKIRKSNMIFFTGGLPDKMMWRLRKFELVSDIEHYKGTIIGSSAGAMIQIYDYHITPDEDYDSFSYNKGLNLIKSFDVEVHYENTELQNNSIDKVLAEKVNKVYAISNSGGIVVENNTVTTIGDVYKYSS